MSTPGEIDSVTIQHKKGTVSLQLPTGTGNVAKTIRKGRFYESKFLDYIQSMKIQGVYADVGANIGNHTVYLGAFTEADSVLSFEPNPKVYDLLCLNIQNNNLSKKVKAYNIALGARKGTVSLVINPSDENGGTRVEKGLGIDQRKLDDFIDNKIGMIKIDVEGYEESVLLGAKRVLKKYKPELFIEITSPQQYRDIYGIIKEFGYAPINVFNNTSTYHFSTTRKPNKVLYQFTKPYLVRRLLRNS